MVAFESFMSLAEAKRRLEGIELNVAGWESWGSLPLNSGVGSSGAGEVPCPTPVGAVPDWACGEVPAGFIPVEVPGSASVGEVPVRGHGEVPVSSSPVEVPGAGSDSGGSDEDPDHIVQERDSDEAEVAARVLAHATGRATKSFRDRVMIRHKTRLTVHRVSVDPARTACGRWVNTNFEIVPFSSEAWPRCINANCFG